MQRLYTPLFLTLAVALIAAGAAAPAPGRFGLLLMGMVALGYGTWAEERPARLRG